MERPTFLALCLCFSAVLNVALTVKITQLRLAPEEAPFLSGKVAPSLALESTLGGRQIVSVAKAGVPTVLYWFNPSCSWCEYNLPAFKALAEQAGGRYRLYAASSAPLPALVDYASKRGLRVPLYSASASVAEQYRLFGTPTTILISGKGELLKRWAGAFNGATRIQVEKALAIALPQLDSSGQGRASSHL